MIKSLRFGVLFALTASAFHCLPAQSSAQEKLKAPEAANNPFSDPQRENSDDPFGPRGNESRPADSQDPFSRAAMRDPFGGPSTDPNDPFSSHPTSDPFAAHSKNNDPFAIRRAPGAKPRGSDPFTKRAATRNRRSGADNAGQPQPAEAARTARQQKLDGRVSFSFIEMPLQDAIRSIAEESNLPFLIDAHRLAEQGMSTDHPVTLSLQDVPLRSFLRIMLSPYDLMAAVDGGVMVITSEKSASKYVKIEVFAVPEPIRANADALKNVVRSAIEPQSWREQGGPYSITSVDNLLVVSATSDVHAEVKQLLSHLQRALKHAANNLREPTERTSTLSRRLDQAVSFSFIELPLEDALQTIATEKDIQVVLDQQALQAANKRKDHPISVDLEEVPLRKFLSLMLGQAGLTFTLHDEILLVTTEDAAMKRLDWQIYVLPASLHGKAEQIAAAAQESIRPKVWESTSGPCTVSTIDDVLVVAAITSIHHEVEQFLAQLQMAERSRPSNRTKAAQ